MKTYRLNLPIFKQGDDMAYCIQQTSTLANAFALQSNNYMECSQTCYTVSEIVKDNPDITVSASTHCIYVTGPSEVLDPLVEDGILIVEEWEDEEDEE